MPQTAIKPIQYLGRNEHKYVCWARRKAQYTNYYIEKDERHQLLKECGPQGLLLFEYYLVLAKQVESTELSDERAADWFGWNIHTSARYRRALIKHEWLYVEQARLSPTKKIYVYHLGKSAVYEAKQGTSP